MWDKDITNNMQPSAASPEGAIRQKQAIGSVLGAAVGVAGTAYQMKKEFDINRGIEEGRQARDLFFESNMQAEVAAADLASNAAQQRALMEENKFLSQWESSNPEETQSIQETSAVNLGVLDNIRSEGQRLLAASRAGMSNEEYNRRVQVLTKATIARYPGLGDQIRQAIGQVTGLPGADEFAAYQFVRSRFSGQGGGKSSGPSEEDIIKDVAKQGGFLIADVVKAYNSDPVTYQQMQDTAKQRTDLERTKLGLEQKTIAEGIVSDRAARARVGTLKLHTKMIGELVKLDVAKTGAFKELETSLQGLSIADQEATLKAFGANISARFRSARTQTLQVIDDMQREANGTISKDVIAELRKEVNDAYDSEAVEMADSNHTLAMLGVLREHSDKTLDQRMRLLQANTGFLSLMQNSPIVSALAQGGAAAEAARREYPQLAKVWDDIQTRAADVLGDNPYRQGSSADSIRRIATGRNQAVENPEPNTNRGRLEDTGTEIAARDFAKLAEENKNWGDPKLVNAISSMLQNHMDGASYDYVSKNDKKLQEMFAKFPPELQTQAKEALNKNYITHIKMLETRAERMKREIPGLEWKNVPGTTRIEAVIPKAKQPVSTVETRMSLDQSLIEGGGVMPPDTQQAQVNALKQKATDFAKGEFTLWVNASARVRAIATGESHEAALKATLEQLSTGVVGGFINKVEQPTAAPAKQPTKTTAVEDDMKKVEQVVDQMVALDPSLNKEYVLSAYQRATPEQRKKLMDAIQRREEGK